MAGLQAWFAALPVAAQLAVFAALGERATWLVRLALSKCGVKLGDDAMAKLQKLLLAATNGAWIAVLAVGLTPAFWGAWIAATASAVLLHEAGAKVTKAVAGPVLTE